MPDTTTYFPLNSTFWALNKVPPGQIAIGGEADPLLVVEDHTGRYYVELGGSDPFMLRPESHLDSDPTFSVEEWRIEVDLASKVEGLFPSLLKGCVYAVAGGQGFGVLEHGGIPHRAFPVAREGGFTTIPHNEGRLVFTRWRIVTGPEDRPFVIATSPQ